MATMLLFAAAREAAGTGEMTVEEGSLRDVLDRAVAQLGPEFEAVLRRCSVVLDEQVHPASEWGAVQVRPHSALAILPPVTGGDHPAALRMIDVADKSETDRRAVATCTIRMRPDVRDLVEGRQLRKGDAIAAATIAGILAAKRVPEIIPLCHPVRTTGVDMTFQFTGDDAIVIEAAVRGRDRTGFEMEALVAASTAALTIYDMAKGDDPAMEIAGLRVLAKSGGITGPWVADRDGDAT